MTYLDCSDSLEGYYEERDSKGEVVSQELFYENKVSDESIKK